MKRKAYSIFIIFFFISLIAAAQKSGYFIRNYLPKEYRGFSQMWQASQDQNGIMYFASSSAVYTYSGQFWEKIAVKSGAATRQVVFNPADKTMYIGSSGDFGYLERDASSELKFVSFLPQLSEKQRSFNDVWKVYFINDAIYFQASERIFKVKNKKVVKVIEAPEGQTFALSFLCNGHFYLRQRNVGLMEIVNDKLQLLPGGEIFKDKPLLAIIPGKNRNLVLTGSEGFYQMDLQPDPEKKSLFSKGVVLKDDYLLNSGVLGSRWLNDTTFMVFSRSGLAFYSASGQLREIISKQAGLSDESVAEVFTDREKNLWLMTQNGLSCVAYNNPMRSYDDKSGYSGAVQLLQIYKDQLYVATANGLFIAKKENVNSGSLSFRATDITNTEVWALRDTKTSLYAASNAGLIRYSENGSELLTDKITNNVNAIGNSDTLVASEKNGFSIVDGKKGKTKNLLRHYELPGEDLLRMGPVKKAKGKPDSYEAWAYTRYRNLLHLRFSVKDSSLQIKRYDAANGLGSADWFILGTNDDSLYLCKTDSCLRYVPKNDNAPHAKCFINAPDVFKKLCEGTFRDIAKPYDNRLLFATPDSVTCYGESADGKSFIIAKIPLSNTYEENSSAAILAFAVTQPDGRVLVVVDDQFFLYDTKQQTGVNYPFQSLIKSVQIGNDSLIYNGGDAAVVTYSSTVPFSKSHIHFRFQSAFFYQDSPLFFTYHLDGYDNDTAWSAPSTNAQKDYTNLPEGNYVFRVKSINTLGQYSTEASFAFTVTPPWYRSYVAYTIYALIFILLMYAVVKISSVRLRRQKERLEALVKERTAEVSAQKQMLETAYDGIKDSIRYAKRIQNALLAGDKLLKEYLNHYFIYYRPKDIVSGDFYWAQSKGDWFYMITADCTGHGVPGAFMSLLNISFLNEGINSPDFVKPDEVLGFVRAEIIDVLKTDGSEEGGKDGMDCVLCAYNFKTNTLLAALSNNPLWIVRNKEIIEVKPDKFPVGKHDNDRRPFSLHEIKLQENDIVYTFTDGYADQFGGEAGKKFKLRQLKELLLSIAHLPMDEQQQIIGKTMRKWIKGLDQVDDMLIVGVKI